MKGKVNKSLVLAVISIIIPICLIIGILDVNIKFIPIIRIPMEIYFYPLYLCPITMIFSIISICMKKNKLGFISLIINGSLILLEILFVIVGGRFLLH